LILLMMAGVTLLLVTACVNVTNLLLSRALSQQGDSAVRLALGASRRHLVRQSTIEALVLALGGAALGAVGAHYAIGMLTRMVGDDLPPWLTVEMDTTVVLASGAITVAVAVTVGLLPGRLAARTDVERILRQDSGRAAGSGHQRLARRWLVGAQAALASVLLVAAGVFAAGLSDLFRIDPGFDSHGVFTFRVDPPFSRYGHIGTTSEFYRRAVEELRTIPGVTAAGTNTNLPFARLDIASPRVIVEGRETGRADEEPFVNFQIVDAGYFDAMGIPLHSGRVFEPTDLEGVPLAGVVSDHVARRFWNGDAIGRRLRVNWNQNGVGSGGGSDLWLTIVGVVRSVRFDSVNDDDGLDVYAANTQMFAGDAFFAIRTQADPAQLTRAVRAAIDRVDPEQSFFDMVTMDARIAKTLWQHRVSTAVLLMFAAVALVLAVIGTYAVTAHAVAAQRREIGIRMALGSSAGAIGWLVARDWMVPVVIGVVAGFAIGAIAAQRLAAVIGVAVPFLAWPFALPAVLALAAAAACSLPVARILRHVALTDTLRAD
jgi:putative ABC transport system permease protein